MSRFSHAAYETSVVKLAGLPREGLPEVAFAGRSNAGKSSAINTLTGIHKLAYVSKTPGRTQCINLFRVDSGYIVDLPGYGYARVPVAIKASWEGLLARYLVEREALAGMMLIMDARHPMTPLDQRMLDWFAPANKPVHVLLTKADKLSRNEASATLLKLRRELTALHPGWSAQLFSSLNRQGTDEARAVLATWLTNIAPATLEAPPVPTMPGR
jgi:GTP-binding protein